MANPESPSDRRSSGLLRIPFVRRCDLGFDDGSATSAFIVNINILGAYIAIDPMPRLGQAVSCRFSLPDSENPIAAKGVVVWQNPRQQHPVHSLPPGMGLRFLELGDEAQRRIEGLVEEYVARNPPAR